MANFRTLCTFTFGGALTLVVVSASAQIVTQSAGLTLGEEYRLVFVTDGRTDASSTNIATYNAFAVAEADTATALAALGTTWTAIASTTSIDAITNTGTTGTGFPVYGLNGALVAATYTQLWSGNLSSGISVSESDNNYLLPAHPVWTGTGQNGTGVSGFQLGQNTPVAGQAGQTGGAWILNTNNTNVGDEDSIYAISGVLTATPEPGGAVLLALGASALIGRRRRSV